MASKASASIEIDIVANPYAEGYDIMRAESQNGEYKLFASPGYWLEKDGHIVCQDRNVERGKTYHNIVRRKAYGYYNGSVGTYSRILGSYSAIVM